jgi:hypothetical protein
MATKKPAKTAQKTSTANVTRVPSYWVFTSFEGKGKAKYPVKGYTDLYDAQMHATDIDGYVVDMYVRAIK